MFVHVHIEKSTFFKLFRFYTFYRYYIVGDDPEVFNNGVTDIRRPRNGLCFKWVAHAVQRFKLIKTNPGAVAVTKAVAI